MEILKYPILKNTNIANWLILASVIVILLSACTTPQSVGYNMKPKKLSKNKENVSSRDTSFITPTQQNETNVEQLNPNDRLPTLREQMKIIADKQAEIEVDVEVIKSEISLIKAELVELKSNLMNNGKIEPKQIFTGEPTPKIQKIPQKQIEEETFILPDEAVKDTPQKKHNNNLKPFNIKPSKNNDNKPQSINKRNEENIITKNSKEQNITDQTEKNTLQTKSNIDENIVLEKVKLAKSLANSGKIKEARQIYQEILKQNPKSELTPIAKKMLQQL